MRINPSYIITFFLITLLGCHSEKDKYQNNGSIKHTHFVNKVNEITHQKSYEIINLSDSTTIKEMINTLLFEQCNNTQTNSTGNFSIPYNWITKSICSLESIGIGTIVLDFIAYRCPYSFIDRRFQRINIHLIDDNIFINDKLLPVDSIESTLYALFMHNDYSERLIVSIKCSADKELQQIVFLFDKILLSYFKFLDNDIQKSFNKRIFKVNRKEIKLIKSNTPLVLSLDTLSISELTTSQ